jgi:hypothetical protein
LEQPAPSADTLHTQAEAADTPVASAEAHIGAALEAHIGLAVEAHIEPALEAHTVAAAGRLAGRLAGLGPLRPPERLARHPRVARWLRSSCKNVGPEGTLCHKKGKTCDSPILKKRPEGISEKYHSPTAK